MSTVHDISPEARLINTIKITWQHGTQWVNGRSGWVGDMVLVAKYLKELKERYSDNISFGAALDNTVDISKDDRAALLGFGSNLDHMRKVFEEYFPDRTSIRNMWNDPKTKALYGKVTRSNNFQEEKEEENEEESEVKRTSKTGWKKNKTGKTSSFKKVKEEGEESSNQHKQEPIDKHELEAEIQKVQTELKQTKQSFEQRVEQEVKKRVEKEVNERLKVFREKEAYYDRVIRGQKKVFTPEQFKLIRGCLHPDRVTDPELINKYTKAFEIFNSFELQLCNEKETPKASSFRQEYAAGKSAMDAREAERKAQKAANDKARRARNKAKAAQAAA